MTGKGFTLWLTGLSGAGKSTLSEESVSRIIAKLEEWGYLDTDMMQAS